MRKYTIINLLLFLGIIFISILPMLIFMDKIEITKFSIPAICLFVFHLLYGFVAYCFRHKGNFLRFNHLFLRHFWFNFVEPNKQYTYTKEYRQTFYRMLALYFAVVPMYIPCIFLTATLVAMPIALIVFFVPQMLFISFEVREISNDIKQARQKKHQEDHEKKEQEYRESIGKWK